MMKGFNNLMTSLDSAMKPSPEDASDTASVRSDISSDCENFEIITYEGGEGEIEDVMFWVAEFQTENKGIVEVASEVIEEESTVTTTSDPSLSSSCKRKDLVRF